jgi:hypothetical protein
VEIEIVKIRSGEQASFFTVRIQGEQYTLFEQFIIENKTKYPNELNYISDRIKAMASTTGTREQFFKMDEGNPGDGVCAMYDVPEKNLRLYCIRYGCVSVILGGGGEKPKDMKALQESEKLTEENYLLRRISSGISKAMKDGLIDWSEVGMDLISDELDPIIIEI